MNTNLVAADTSRTEKTICLAVSPSLKSFDIFGRARLFEVVQKVKAVNLQRKACAPGHTFTGESYFSNELSAHPELSVSYIIAPPRMAHYMEYSTKIYEIYLQYIAPEDIHVYSIDEVFMDVTAYLRTYSLSAKELAGKSYRMSLKRPASPPPPASARTFIYARSQWISWQSILSLTQTGSGLQNWTRCGTGNCCGITGRSRTSGGWAGCRTANFLSYLPHKYCRLKSNILNNVSVTPPLSTAFFYLDELLFLLYSFQRN